MQATSSPPAPVTDADPTLALHAPQEEAGEPKMDPPPATSPASMEERLQMLYCFETREFGVPELGSDAGVEKFDASLFVQTKLRLGVPLETIYQDLDSFSQQLHRLLEQEAAEKLQPAMRELSHQSTVLRKKVQQVQQPVQKLIQQLRDACDLLEKMMEVVREKVGAAAQAAARQSADAAFIKAMLLYDRLAHLINEAQKAIAGPADASPTTSEEAANALLISWKPRLERIEVLVPAVLELRRATHLMGAAPLGDDLTRAGELAEVQAWCAAAEEAVLKLLEEMWCEVCRQYLQSQPQPREAASPPGAEAAVPGHTCAAALLVMREVPLLFQVLGAAQRFASACRTMVLVPFVQGIVSWTATTHTRHNIEATLGLLRQLEQGLTRTMPPMLALWAIGFPRTKPFPVCDAVWPAVTSVVAEKMAYLFDASIPEAFRRKHLAAASLEAAVLGLCVSDAERTQLQASTPMLRWRSKWNTDVYAAECIMSAAKQLGQLTEEWSHAVTSAMSSPPSSQAPPPSGAEGWAAARERRMALWSGVAGIPRRFFGEAFLSTVTAAFLRQCISAVKSTAAKTHVVALAVLQALPQEMPTDPSVDDGAHVRSLALAVGLIEDIRLAGRFLETELPALVTNAVRSGSAVPPEAIRDSLRAVCGFGQRRMALEETPALRDAVVRLVTRAATQPLQNIKAVRSIFTHTNREAPTSASWYPPSVAAPLRLLARSSEINAADSQRKAVIWSLDVAAVEAGAQEDTRDMLRSVIESVLGVFTQLARETLEAAKKAEEGWEKLRRKRDAAGAANASAASAGAGDGITDRDKMVLQLYLDATEVVRLITAVVPPGAMDEASPAMCGLFDLLSRGAALAANSRA